MKQAKELTDDELRARLTTLAIGSTPIKDYVQYQEDCLNELLNRTIQRCFSISRNKALKEDFPPDPLESYGCPSCRCEPCKCEISSDCPDCGYPNNGHFPHKDNLLEGMVNWVSGHTISQEEAKERLSKFDSLPSSLPDETDVKFFEERIGELEAELARWKAVPMNMPPFPTLKHNPPKEKL